MHVFPSGGAQPSSGPRLSSAIRNSASATAGARHASNIDWNRIFQDQLPGTLASGPLAWALLLVKDIAVQRLMRALLAQRLGRLLYDRYSRRRDELTAQLTSGSGTVGVLQKEMGHPPALVLPYDDWGIRLASQVCLLATLPHSTAAMADGPTPEKDIHGLGDTLDEMPALDDHFLRDLLPCLLSKTAAIRFHSERTDASKGWVDALSGGMKDKKNDGEGEGEGGHPPALNAEVVESIVESVLEEQEPCLAKREERLKAPTKGKGKSKVEGESEVQRERELTRLRAGYGTLLGALAPSIYDSIAR